MVRCWIRFGLRSFLLGWILSQPVQANEAFSEWFKAFKTSATDAELHDFLYSMPKGGTCINIYPVLFFPNGGGSSPLARQPKARCFLRGFDWVIVRQLVRPPGTSSSYFKRSVSIDMIG